MSIELKIKTHLVANGITQKELCERIGITQAKLNLSLNGHRKLSLKEYALICEGLNVSTNHFFSQQNNNLGG